MFGLGLARLRKEGFASLDGSRQRPGYVITRPLQTWGSRLSIKARCRKGGTIRVAVLDGGDLPVDGCCLKASDPFSGDSVEHIVTWHGNAAFSAGWRKLHFYLEDAEVFAFRFLPAEGETPRSSVWG